MKHRIIKETNGAGRSVYYIEEWDKPYREWRPMENAWGARWEVTSERKAKRELKKLQDEGNITRRVVWP